MRVTNTYGATVTYQDAIQMSALGGSLTSQLDVSGRVVNGQRVVGARYPGFVTTLSDVIAALRSHGLIN